MSEDKEDGGSGSILGIIIFIAICYFIYTIFAPRWTLMVCDELMSNGLECSTNSYINENAYRNKQSCIQEGNAFLSMGSSGFECGRGCKHDGIFMVCKEVCNRLGNCY